MAEQIHTGHPIPVHPPPFALPGIFSSKINDWLIKLCMTIKIGKITIECNSNLHTAFFGQKRQNYETYNGGNFNFN